jgi:hypothetical protein
VAEHAGDLLSALLDGELGAEDAAAVRAHVGECTDCSRELDDVRIARRLVRELPAAEPPSGFLASLLDEPPTEAATVVPLEPHRRRRGARLSAMAAASIGVAAAVVVIVAAPWASTSNTIEPDLEVALEQHESTVGALEDDGVLSRSATRLQAEEPVTPTTAKVQPMSQIDDDFDAPQELGGYELVEAYDVAGGVHLLYHRGAYALSVFEREGDIDVDALPPGGTMTRIGGHRAWRWDDIADGRLIVIDADGVVITIAGDEPGDAVLVAARDLVG